MATCWFSSVMPPFVRLRVVEYRPSVVATWIDSSWSNTMGATARTENVSWASWGSSLPWPRWMWLGAAEPDRYTLLAMSTTLGRGAPTAPRSVRTRPSFSCTRTTPASPAFKRAAAFGSWAVTVR